MRLPAQAVPPGPLISAGYSAPRPIKAAPGQVITLFLHTDGAAKASFTAAGLPLPSSLGGYSLNLNQTFAPTSVPVPLFSVYPVDSCYGLVPFVCSGLTAITVQIPWELIPNIPHASRPQNFAVLNLSLDGANGQAIALDPQPDSIHIINTCDSTTPPGTERPAELTGDCKPLAVHADGRIVTAVNPAKPGEAIVLYAFGLGKTSGSLVTGDATPETDPLEEIRIGFTYGANLAPSLPSGDQTPLNVQLTPTQVGLYQISFVVPPVLASLPACTTAAISSNLTVNIGRLISFDGAAICVEVPPK